MTYLWAMQLGADNNLDFNLYTVLTMFYVVVTLVIKKSG